ncbi:hypothetical protein BH11MYX3_BH11MYX3_26620 [soil metagenome]
MRVACPSCGREIHAVARHCKHCHAVLARRDHLDDEDVLPPSPRRSRLPLVAVALVGVAAVLLVVAVVGRSGAPDPAEPPVGAKGSAAESLGTPAADSLVSATVAAMYGAACRHEVACGSAAVERCQLIESTMKQMPRELAVHTCAKLDEVAAKLCLEELAARGCERPAASLEVLELQKAIMRVASCRHACK